MSPPGLSHLFDFDVTVAPPVVIDPGYPGRRMIAITGGTVTGTWTGRVLPGASDWQIVRSDTHVELSAQYIIELDGYGRVEVQSNGLRHASTEVLAAIDRGDQVDASRYYFRTALRFRTAAPGLARLNTMIAIGAGTRLLDRVLLAVYEVG